MFVTNGGREVEGQVAEHDFAQVRNYNHVDNVDDIDDVDDDDDDVDVGDVDDIDENII